MQKAFIILIVFLFTFSLYANGSQEYTVTKSLTVYDGTNADPDKLNLGGDFFFWDYPHTTNLSVLEYNTAEDGGAGDEGKCLRLKWNFSLNSATGYCGVNLMLQPEEKSMDLSEYTGVQFYVKGKGRFTTKIATDCTRKETNYHTTSFFQLSDEWKLYTIPFKKYQYPGWGTPCKFNPAAIYGFEFQTARTESSSGEMYIDNVAFVKLKLKEEEAPEKDKPKKLLALQDKRIAVVGLDSGEVDASVADTLVNFIVNAFVNEGTFKVVDRSSIEKILSEQEFQMQDFANTEKVIAVGKLAGAEYIVVGNLSRIGDEYYLNIKLISVETAEIAGSSITKAKSSSGFFDMSNEAVDMLFSK